jgi:hypothetical protein
MVTHDDLITKDDERRERLLGNALRLDAELSVLDLYDNERRGFGYDYGNGQRFAEVSRVRRERDAARRECKIFGYGMGLGDLDASPELCLAEFERISTQRTARYRREAHLTRTAQLAERAWQLVHEHLLDVAKPVPPMDASEGFGYWPGEDARPSRRSR